ELGERRGRLERDRAFLRRSWRPDRGRLDADMRLVLLCRNVAVLARGLDRSGCSGAQIELGCTLARKRRPLLAGVLALGVEQLARLRAGFLGSEQLRGLGRALGLAEQRRGLGGAFCSLVARRGRALGSAEQRRQIIARAAWCFEPRGGRWHRRVGCDRRSL